MAVNVSRIGLCANFNTDLTLRDACTLGYITAHIILRLAMRVGETCAELAALAKGVDNVDVEDEDDAEGQERVEGKVNPAVDVAEYICVGESLA